MAPTILVHLFGGYRHFLKTFDNYQLGLLLTGLFTFDRELEKLKDEVIEREKKLRQPQTEYVKPETKPQSTRYVK